MTVLSVLSTIWSVPMQPTEKAARKSVARPITSSKKDSHIVRSNAKYARSIWGTLPKSILLILRELGEKFSLSIADGDVRFLDGRWYVTHSGLLRIASRRRCASIVTSMDRFASDVSARRWVFRASVYKNPVSRPFVRLRRR